MRPLIEAQREVLAAMSPLPHGPRPLAQCRGLVVAQDVVAPHDIPPFANSGMDGYAVIAADLDAAPAVLRVLEDVAAGSVPTTTVTKGSAVKIMTGAPMPDGADSVAIVEESEDLGDGTVRLWGGVSRGDHVRAAGGDVRAGDVVLTAGTRLRPAHLGVLASVGVSQPDVVGPPTVAVLSTGDELQSADTPEIRRGSIRDSNRPTLIAALEELGVSILDLGIVPDDERLLRAALGEASSRADAVVTSGGVSMGEYDLVKHVLSELGSVGFWRVAMQPAKPFAFGFLGDTPLFGLPGNPVSVFVAFEQFVRPALLRRMGARALFRPRSKAVAGEPLSTNPEKTVFLRVEVDHSNDGDVVSLSGAQGSNVLSALAAADAFAVVPVGVGDVPEGAAVTVEWFTAAETRSAQEAFDE